ncbi:hypothetical protein ACLOJK_004730 [Asimina triloba]
MVGHAAVAVDQTDGDVWPLDHGRGRKGVAAMIVGSCCYCNRDLASLEEALPS